MELGRRVYVVCVLLLLGACQEGDAPAPSIPVESIEQEQVTQNCFALGGTPVINGFGIAMCQTQTNDGGKSCSSSDDCEGFCLADGQICTSDSPHFGCFETFENGQRPTVCVD